MKKMMLTVFTVVALTGMVMAQQQTMANAQTTATATPANMATCTWKNTTHNFGKVTQGKPVSFTYEFTNTGNAPLIITSVQPGCGCTTQDYTKEAVAPGKKGFVTLTYNAASVGQFTKSATVNTNAENGTLSLTFTGEVVAQ